VGYRLHGVARRDEVSSEFDRSGQGDRRRRKKKKRSSPNQDGIKKN